jgi:hypothetical protein
MVATHQLASVVVGRVGAEFGDHIDLVAAGVGDGVADSAAGLARSRRHRRGRRLSTRELPEILR